jgi:hypothetical protein
MGRFSIRVNYLDYNHIFIKSDSKFVTVELSNNQIMSALYERGIYRSGARKYRHGL